MPLGGEVLNQVGILLNGESYRLIRETVAQRLGLARRWHMERVPLATTIIPRPDVRPGFIESEYVITWNTWHKGISGDLENLPNTLHLAQKVNGLSPGRLAMMGPRAGENYTAALTGRADPSGAVPEFTDPNGSTRLLFDGSGQYVYRYSHLISPVTDRDNGSGFSATDLIVFNNELVEGFGGSTNTIASRNTTGTWTAATDATYADYFARVEHRLARATAINEVSFIASTDNPLTLANWSAGIAVGDDDVPITDLNAQGERLVVSKEDGLYLGDRNAIFPNVLELARLTPHPNNGKNTVVMGRRIFYPHRNGLILYETGTYQEVGPQLSFPNTELEESAAPPPNMRIAGQYTRGAYLYVVTEPSFRRWADPTGVRKTTDNEASYTDYTAVAVDNIYSATDVVLSSLDTAANGDYFYIGYSATFYGAYIVVARPNINAATLAAQYWTGSAWASISIFDGTASQSRTLAEHGIIYVASIPADWATNAIDGTTAYWLRFNVSAALNNDVALPEIRVIIDEPVSYVLRARLRERNDVRDLPVIWEYVTGQAGTPKFTEIAVHHRGGASADALIIQSQTHRHRVGLEVSAVETFLRPDEVGPFRAILPKHDAGMPELLKQFTQIVIKGRTIGTTASHTVDVYYRVDNATTWTSAQANIAVSPTTISLSGVTGRAIQLRVDFDNYHPSDVPTEVNELEVVFRPLYTYKNVYTAFLELADHQGEGHADANVALSNLEARLGAAAVTLVTPEPAPRAKTVNVLGMREVEIVQTGAEPPVVVVELKMMET